MKNPLFAISIAAAAFALPCVAEPASQPGISLEKIMADPDWIGPPVKEPYWSVDGRAVYYSMKRSGSPIVDLHRIELVNGKDEVVDAAAMAGADGPAVYDRAGKRAAFVRNHDIFVRDLSGGRLTQVTRTPQAEKAPRFSSDGRLLSFRVDNDWFVHDFSNGVTSPAAIVKAEKDPNAPPAADDLRDMQLRTFSTLKRLHDDAEAVRKNGEALQKADISRAVTPFYLGEEVRILDTELSPDAHWMVVITEPKAHVRGKEGQLTRYVTESGYEEFEKERLRVGRNPPAAQSFVLLNLVDHTAHSLDTDKLPGIYDDPLRLVREENAKAHPLAKQEPAAAAADRKARGVVAVDDEPDGRLAQVIWSGDS